MPLRSWFLILITTTVIAGCGTTLPPEVGAAAPDFTLTAQDGKSVRLQDYRGKWVVLFFYPIVNPGVELVVRNFQSDLPAYGQLNAVVLGVSTQEPESHKELIAQEGLKYTLLTDSGAEVAAQYGSIMPLLNRIHDTKSVRSTAARNTFIIAPDGKIARIFSAFDARYHSAEVLNALKGLQPS
jgi:peroxiredoxin Q/BCP